MALNFTDENFEEEVLNSSKITLVDFWAPWCGPCQMMSPVIDDLAEETKNDFKVGKVNVDENTQIAQKYAIMSIPTIIIFKDGQKTEELTGIQSKEALLEKLNLVKNK